MLKANRYFTNIEKDKIISLLEDIKNNSILETNSLRNFNYTIINDFYDIKLSFTSTSPNKTDKQNKGSICGALNKKLGNKSYEVN